MSHTHVTETKFFLAKPVQGWEVDCAKESASSEVVTLFFPREAKGAVQSLRKGAKIRYVAMAVTGGSYRWNLNAEATAAAVYLENGPMVPNVVGKDLRSSRRLLKAAGWEPRETFDTVDGTHSGQRESLRLQAGELYKAGFREVAHCYGTGTAGCTLNYVKDGQCLAVYTLGEWSKGDPLLSVSRADRHCPDEK